MFNSEYCFPAIEIRTSIFIEKSHLKKKQLVKNIFPIIQGIVGNRESSSVHGGCLDIEITQSLQVV